MNFAVSCSYCVQIERGTKEDEEGFRGHYCYKSKWYKIVKSKFDLEIRFLTTQEVKIADFFLVSISIYGYIMDKSWRRTALGHEGTEMGWKDLVISCVASFAAGTTLLSKALIKSSSFVNKEV